MSAGTRSNTVCVAISGTASHCLVLGKITQRALSTCKMMQIGRTPHIETYRTTPTLQMKPGAFLVTQNGIVPHRVLAPPGKVTNQPNSKWQGHYIHCSAPSGTRSCTEVVGCAYSNDITRVTVPHQAMPVIHHPGLIPIRLIIHRHALLSPKLRLVGFTMAPTGLGPWQGGPGQLWKKGVWGGVQLGRWI